MVSKGRGNFLKVKCLDCDNEQIIFDRAASDVKCIICGKTLVKSRGAKAKHLTFKKFPLPLLTMLITYFATNSGFPVLKDCLM